MELMTAAELRSFSSVRDFLPQTMVPVQSTPLVPEGMPGMVAPQTAPGLLYTFTASGNIQQGDNLPTIVDVQFPWESSPRRNHKQVMEMQPCTGQLPLLWYSAPESALLAVLRGPPSRREQKQKLPRNHSRRPCPF